jgi:hypothetical protein
METHTTPTTSANSRIWAISLVVLCALIVGYGFFYSTNQSDNLAALAGANLPAALVIWAIFSAAVGRNEGRKRTGAAFLAIYGTLVVSSLVGYSQQKKSANLVATEVQSAVSSIGSGKDAQGSPQRIENLLDTTPKSHGNFGELENISKPR